MEENEQRPLNPNFSVGIAFYGFDGEVWYQGDVSADATDEFRGWSTQVCAVTGEEGSFPAYPDVDYGLDDNLKQRVLTEVHQEALVGLESLLAAIRRQCALMLGFPTEDSIEAAVARAKKLGLIKAGWVV